MRRLGHRNVHVLAVASCGTAGWGTVATHCCANCADVAARLFPALQDPAVLQQQLNQADASLVQLQQECNRAVATAQAMVGRPTTPLGSPRTSQDGAGLCSVEHAVRQLVHHLKVSSAPDG